MRLISAVRAPQKAARALTNKFPDQDLDLSRNKTLGVLAITAESLIGVLALRRPATTSSAFKALLSTIRSPVFSGVIVVYREGDSYDGALCKFGREIGDKEAWYHGQFDVFRAMNEARDYQLALVVDHAGYGLVGDLERAAVVEQAKGGLPLLIDVPYTGWAH